MDICFSYKFQLVFVVSFTTIVCIALFPTSLYLGEIRAASEPGPNTNITITSHRSIDYAPLLLAKEKGMLDNISMPVHIILNNRHSDSESTYLNGEADGILEEFADTVLRNSLSNSSDIQSKVVYVTDYSVSADSIISKGHDNLTGLTGKKIGFDPAITSSRLFVTEILRKFGLEAGEYVLVPIPQYEAISSMENGSIYASHVREPIISTALSKGFHVLATAGELPGIVTDVLAFRTSATKDHSDEIQSVVNAFSKGMNFLKSNTTDALMVLENSHGVNATELGQDLRAVSLLNLSENRISMGQDSNRTLPYFANLTETFYLRNGLTQSMPNPSRMFDSAFVDKS